MDKQPRVDNEQERLERLYEYDILDSSADNQLDEITELATIICDVPIGLISIIDKDRQWFKSKIGLEVDQTPREQAFCQYAILNNELFEVENALQDERFKNNPLVTGDPNIRFYAGYPLFVEEDIPLGTLCMISDKPNKLTDAQRRALRILSEQVVNFFRLQKELRDKKKYEKFFQITNEPIYLANMSGYFEELNPAFIKKIGFNEEQLLQTPFIELIHPDDRGATLNEMRSLADGKETITFINRYKSSEGCYKWMDWNVVVDRESELIYAVARDISEEKAMRRRLHKTEKRYQTFFNNAQGILIALDNQERIAEISAEISTITGIENSEYIGKKLIELFSLEQKVKLDAFWLELLEEKQSEIILKLLDAQSNEYTFYFRGVTVVLEGEENYTMLTGVDISSRIRMEENLKKTAHLAEESNRMQKDFLANMSHEIRTPLNAIIGFAEILESTELRGRQAQYVEAVQKAGNHLLRIINDILDFSKVEADEIELEFIAFNLQDLFSQLSIMFEKAAEEKGIRLSFYLDNKLPNWVIGDLARLKQVLVNILSNAVKFTDEGKVELFVKVEKYTTTEIFLEFRIKDSGIGIPKEKQQAIFERFRQANAAVNRKYGGTGLGLAIAKQLILLQKGELEIESEEGKGSEFTVRIPFKKAPNVSKAAKLIEPQNIRLIGKVLVVEDNEMNRQIVKEYLRNIGLALFFANNGQEALDFLEREEVDLILMDLQMPIMDGYSASVSIRNELKLKTPIIALTAHSMQEEEQRCLNLGMNAYLSKPYRKTDLLNLMIPYLKLIESIEEGTYFNLKRFMEFAEGDNALARILAKNFIENAPRLIEHLYINASEKDYQKVANIVHELKPFYNMLGVEQLSEICEELEKMPKHEDLKEKVISLQVGNNELIKALEAHF